MPRSRGSDLPQRPSPRAPLHLKTTACSEANSLHRPVVDRSPKLEERRYPRSPLHEIQKKRGTKVIDLETKLSKAQEELKKLRDQLASAEVAKLDAEDALEKAKKQIPALAPTATKGTEEEKLPLTPPTPLAAEDSQEKPSSEQEPKSEDDSLVNLLATTDVFEVVVPTEAIHEEKEDDEGNAKEDKPAMEKEEEETKAMIENDKDANEMVAAAKEKKEEQAEEEEKEEEITEPAEIQESLEVVELRNNLLEKEKEVEFLLEENAIFKRKAKEEAEKIAAAARVKEDELRAKLSSMEEELKESRAKAERLVEQLEVGEGAKATLEAELKRLKVQTDQWRKAAEAAAAVLTGGGDEKMGGRRVPERFGSMDKHIGGGHVDWGSPLMAAGDMEEERVFGGGRQKATGTRMFGDLWKKKGQQK